MNESNDQAIEMQKNVYRVATNLLVLLDIGLFPGKHALGLEECKGMVASLVADAKKNIEPKIVPPTTPITPAVA